MTVTSFDNGVPHHFYRAKTLQGRLTIFLDYVVPVALKRSLSGKEKDNISIIVVSKDYIEVLYEGKQIGVMKLVEMTKDFIFKS